MGRTYPRAHPRYRVENPFPLEVEIPSGRMSSKHVLATLGLGGFGFFGTAKLADLLRKGALPLYLLIGNKKVEISGRARYCQFVPSGVKDLPYFIGMQFEALPAEVQSFLKTLIQAGVVKGHLKNTGNR